MRCVRLCAITFALMSVGCPGLSTLLRRYGFTELKPPSTLFAPGTMVWVRRAEPFTAGVICTQRASLGRAFTPLQAPTASGEMASAVRGDFSLGHDSLGKIRQDQRFAAISNITVSLSNPLIHTLSDADVLGNLPFRDPMCSRAIAGRREAGFEVTMIASALMADVVYNMQYATSATLQVQDRRAMLEALAPQLGVEHATVTETAIAGQGLFWGVVDDAHLASLELEMVPPPGLPEAAVPPDDTLRLLAAGSLLRLEPRADVE